MGKLIVVSSNKNNYKMDFFINNQLISKLAPSEEKYFEIEPGIYQSYCYSYHTQNKSKQESLDLSRNIKIEIVQGFVAPKINIEYISVEELEKYSKNEFIKLNNIEINNPINNILPNSNNKSVNNKELIGIVIFMIIILVVSPMIFSIIEKNKETSAEDNNGSNQIIQKNIGEDMDCGDYIARVEQVMMKTGKIDSIQSVPDGHEWIGLIVTVKNTSEEEQTIYNDDFEIINSNGERLKHSVIVYNVFDNYEKLSSPTLISGGSKTGYISFDNDNQDNSNITIELKCNSISWFAEDQIYQIKYQE